MTVPTITNLAEANEYLERFYENVRADQGYTLVNMHRLMKYLDNPQNKLRVVHVAGTSGKTSTAYYVSALLTATGQKTGLTVSPHIDWINERIQIDGQPLDEKTFCAALAEFLELIEEAPVQPSWFECLVAFAYWYFARQKVDYAVIEVGLGGLKDGTNVITRPDKVCIITDIGYDHMNLLGKTLAQIAAQKAGIIQSHNQVFTYRQPPEVIQVLDNAAAAQKATLHVIGEADNDDPAMPDYQFRNWTLAEQVYKYLAGRDKLPILTEASLRETRQILVPGRMDVRHKDGKIIVMDGAHNAQKVAAMIGSFQKLYPGQKPAVLVSLKQGKEYEQVVPLLADLAGRVIITGFELSQDVPLHSMDPQILADSFRQAGLQDVSCLPDQAAAVHKLLAGPEKLCLVTGSLYLLGRLRNNGLI